MAHENPYVSIGLPVYNGENFLHEAITSILAQTFQDFELIISDNASTDKTEEICRTFMDQDKRIKYFRNRENVGVMKNIYRVFALSSGKYFKLAAHDDLCHPELLRNCIDFLDRDLTTVLCYSRAVTIDDKGHTMKDCHSRPLLGSHNVRERFHEALIPHEPIPLFGVVRTEILKRTNMSSYPGQELVLLAELTLHGRFHEIPDVYFFLREHPHRSVRTHNWRDPQADILFWDPSKVNKMIFPQWKLFSSLVSAIYRAPLGWNEKCICYLYLKGWLIRYRQELIRDLILAGVRVPAIGSIIGRTNNMCMTAIWKYRVRRFSRDIWSIIPSNHIFILVDDGTIDRQVLERWHPLPFLEHDGEYWGCPKDDKMAIREFERLQQRGAEFIVFGWPAFWWLDYFAEFHLYLRSKFQCVLKNERIIVFNISV